VKPLRPILPRITQPEWAISMRLAVAKARRMSLSRRAPGRLSGAQVQDSRDHITSLSVPPLAIRPAKGHGRG
jgi:hypothetical protein